MLARTRGLWEAAYLVGALSILAGSASAQMGHVMNGVGPVNQSMAGVATGTPLDAAGTLQWNPAGLRALDHDEIEFGVELLVPTTKVSSSVSAPMAMSGTSESDAGDSAIPNFAFAYRVPDTRWSWGVGAFGIGGFGVDYGASTQNPILLPPPNGFGTVYSQFQLLQIAPTVAYSIDEHWSIGFAPTINNAQLAVQPACFAPPDDANGDATPSYPSATHSDKSWGYGAQLGVFYAGKAWDFGASYKSRQDFETFHWNATDELGGPRRISLDLDFPAIASVGVGYRGIDRWHFGADVRYIDYEHTNGFDERGFAPDFSVAGFGWDSILVAAVAAQFELTDRWSLRGGYSWNENPISDEQSTFNVPAPAVIQNHLAVGASFCGGENWCVDFAYRHGFENSIEGPIGHPTFGVVPGSSVENSLETDSFLVGFRVSF